MNKTHKNTSTETRIDNRLNNFGMRGLSAIEQNLWWTLAKLIKDKGTNSLKFSRLELESLSGFYLSNKSKKSFVKTMESIGEKLVSLNTNLYDSDTKTRIIFSLFPVYKVSEDGIEVEVSRYFEDWFNNIQKNFTRIDLSVLVNLKSSYSKELYRFLMQWKNIRNGAKYPGFWSIGIDDFRRLMCVPGSYYMRDLKKIIIEPAMTELLKKNEDNWSPLEYLDVQYILKKGSKKKVEKIEFTFKQSTPNEKLVNESAAHKEELLPVGYIVNTKSYENNFENGYLPGQNSPTKGFKSWLKHEGFFNLNDEYFDMRSTAKKSLISIYKEKVIDNKSKAWTDMRFFASAYSVVKSNKAMTTWNIEDAYAEIRGGKRLDIPQEVYSSLPEDKGKQLQAFALKGEII